VEDRIYFAETELLIAYGVIAKNLVEKTRFNFAQNKWYSVDSKTSSDVVNSTRELISPVSRRQRLWSIQLP
jgi:hypothetical protein